MNAEELVRLVSKAYRDTSDPLYVPEQTGRWANNYRGPLGTAAETQYGQTPSPPMDVLDVSAMAPGVGDVTGPIADLRMYARDPEQITPTNVGLSMAGLLPFVPSAAGVVVHHGTPHRWMSEPEFPEGRPRMDKIGTGEGAQAYGHGIYFAESPGVARSYSEMVVDPYAERVQLANIDGDIVDLSERVQIKGMDLPAPRSEAIHNLYQAKMKGESPQAEIDRLRGSLDTYRKVDPQAADYYRDVAEIMEQYKDAKDLDIGVGPRPGSIYELDLPDDIVPRMLDLDAPIWQQGEAVKAAVQDLVDPYESTGIDAMIALQQRVRDMALSRGNSAERVAETLAKKGIPGTKYYDAMSRNAGEGSRNYVVWDQDLLNQMPILGVK